MNNTKISCILALLAIILFVIMVTFGDEHTNGAFFPKNIEWIILGLIAEVVLIIVGLVFSIKAIIMEKTVLSWICTIVLLMPMLLPAVFESTVEYFQNKAFYAAQYNSPQSQKKREKMYEKYNLPDSLDISEKNKFASTDILNDHYPIISVFNCGNGLWYFSSQEAAVGFGGQKDITSLAIVIDIDKSVVPLLTSLPANHYATRKDAKSSWITGEYYMPPAENENENK